MMASSATQQGRWCFPTNTTTPLVLQQQFNTLHARVCAALLQPSNLQPAAPDSLMMQHQQQHRHRVQAATFAQSRGVSTGWQSASQQPPRQQRQQQQQQQQRGQAQPPQLRQQQQQQQHRPPTLFQQQRRHRVDDNHQQPTLDQLGQRSQQTPQSQHFQQPQQQQQHLDQQHLQQQQPQQPEQQHKFTWGYLSSDTGDEWTWDDDYNEQAIAKAAAEAQQLPPTPRQAQMASAAAASSQQRPTVITRLPEQFNRQVLSNAVLLVDKPVRWSSADVVRQLQAALKLGTNSKVCFAAPLDTEASGLLIVLLGAASRLTPKLEPLERVYTGTFRLGLSTTTYDATGETLESNPWQHVTDADVAAAAQGFVGEISQVPCMWSSSKYKNKPLRWYAERGEVVAREAKAVYITSIETWRAQQQAAGDSSSSSSSRGRGRASSRNGGGVSEQAFSSSSSRSDTMCFRVVASKGASVRVLVHDIGKALGCGAHVTSLRREGIGGFSVDTAWSLEVLLPLARKYAKGFRQQPPPSPSTT